MTMMMESPVESAGFQGEYAGDARSATQARHDAEEILGSWQLEELVYGIRQVVAEMMANAVSHCVQRPVVMTLRRIQDGVRVSVLDSCTEPVVPRDASPGDENGRGMLLIEAFSTRWDWEWTKTRTLTEGTRTSGKRVWADLHL